MTEGYITYTKAAQGVWIAWHTRMKPPENVTGREIAALDGPVLFAVGPTADAALASLHAQHPSPASDA